MMTPSGQLILDDDSMTVRCISVSEMDNNVYLLTSKSTGQQVLIDAADDFAAIQKFVEAAADEDFSEPGEPAGLTAVFTTHGHWDHIRALQQVAEYYGAATFAGKADTELIRVQEYVETTTELSGGEIFSFEDFALEAISLTGHTPGSMAYVLRGIDEIHPELIFSGDSLFPGGVGKTETAEDFRSLFTDVKTKIFGAFTDDTVILPGHGKYTTLGADRNNLDSWEKRGW